MSDIRELIDSLASIAANYRQIQPFQQYLEENEIAEVLPEIRPIMAQMVGLMNAAAADIAKIVAKLSEQSRQTQLEGELADAKSSLKERDDTIATMTTDHASAISALEEKLAAATSSLEEANTRQHNATLWQNKHDELARTIAQEREVKAQVDAQIIKLGEDLIQRQTELEQCQTDLQQCQATLQQRQADLDSTKQDLLQLETTSFNRESRDTELLNQADNDYQEVSATLEETSTLHEAAKSKLEAKVERLRNQLAAQQIATETVRTTLQEANGRVVEVEASLALREAEFTTARDEINATHEALAFAQAANNTLTTNLAVTRALQQTLAADHAAVVTELNAELAASRERVVEVEALLDKGVAAVDAVQGELATATAETLRITQDWTKTKALLAERETDVATLRSQFTTLQGQLTAAQTAVTAAQAAATTAQTATTMGNVGVTNAQEATATAVAQITAIQAQLAATQTRLVTAREETITARAETVEARAETLDVREHLAVVDTESEGLSTTLTEYEQMLHDISEERDRALDLVEERDETLLIQRAAYKQQVRTTVRSMNENAALALQVTQQDHARVKERFVWLVNSLTEALTLVRGELARSGNDMRVVECRASDTAAEVTGLRDELTLLRTSHEDSVRELQQQVTSAKKDLATSAQTKEEFRIELERAKADVSDRRATNESMRLILEALTQAGITLAAVNETAPLSFTPAPAAQIAPMSLAPVAAIETAHGSSTPLAANPTASVSSIPVAATIETAQVSSSSLAASQAPCVSTTSVAANPVACVSSTLSAATPVTPAPPTPAVNTSAAGTSFSPVAVTTVAPVFSAPLIATSLARVPSKLPATTPVASTSSTPVAATPPAVRVSSPRHSDVAMTDSLPLESPIGTHTPPSTGLVGTRPAKRKHTTDIDTSDTSLLVPGGKRTRTGVPAEPELRFIYLSRGSS